MRTISAALLFLPAIAAGQVPATLVHGHATPVPSVTAARRVGAVTLDAKLDEEAWKAAQPITDFTQVDPSEGKPATQRAEVRFLFDDDALYVGAKMYDSNGAKGVTTRVVRRDASFDSDMFEIVIDGYHDHLSRAFFDLNPSGSKSDYIGIGNSCCDQSWDPIWEAATHIDADGWTAEIRIPYSQLRFSRDSVQEWGLQVRRFIHRNQEQDQWSFWKKTEAGGPSRFGHLTGLRIPAAKTGLELLPYVVSKSTSLAGAANDPFRSHGRPTLRLGLDLKDRLTSNLTFDATINPDFGQVEVDPAVLNLSAFESFFPEKRPFFIEGSQVFGFGNFSCNFCSNQESMSGFYSRRIGRAPTGASLALNNFAYADVPDATTILGAGKITGRTASGYTVGLLNAVTGRATARVEDIAGARTSQEVEPLADYFVGRLKRDFMSGNLVVGGIVSGVARNIDSTFAPRLARHAEMYGSDVVYTWHEHMFSFRGNAAVTNVSGDAREIALRQQSSARYFQRPDRGAGSGAFLSNRYDTTATSLRGAGGYARIAKETGDWFGETAINTRSPGYETNDYAFQQRADYVSSYSNLGRTWTQPTSWYRQFLVIGGVQTHYNFEGDHTLLELHEYASTTTPQFWNVSAFHIGRAAEIDDRQLRGGPAVIAPANDYISGNVSTDSRRQVVGNANLSYGWDRKGGSSPSFSIGADYRPASNVAVSFNPSWSTALSNAQYVSAIGDSSATAFFGTRYVMSYLDQHTLGLDTRLSVTFSPTMTLELYVQPFFASGHYYNFEEYAAPRTDRLNVYGRDVGRIAAARDKDGVVSQYTIDPDGSGPAKQFRIGNPDFSQQSLRGNTVFRWEYRPGSVLYVAWTQSRVGDSAFGDLDLTRDRIALLAARPDNIFLVKASWWLPK
ncbi:MAG: putative rane associated hydrolase [Gemmatimonadetes bacterium]|nr:putative rane associated hydrolase [Gemmatimonadota bacterium]